jgi:hypothetical protein
MSRHRQALRRDADLDGPGHSNGTANLFVTHDLTSGLPPRQRSATTVGAFLRRLEFHFASKHAGGAQYGRVRDQRGTAPVSRPPHQRSESLRNEIAAWRNSRNRAGARFRWIFATDKARARVYPPPPRVKITVMNHGI